MGRKVKGKEEKEKDHVPSEALITLLGRRFLIFTRISSVIYNLGCNVLATD